MNDATKLLRLGQVAERLQVSRTTAYSLAQRGILRCVRMGRLVRVSETVLAEFIANGGATAEAPDLQIVGRSR